VEETMNTLRYATSARNIQTTATKNVVQTISPEEAAKLRRDNELLQQQVKELQSTVQKMTLAMDDDSSSSSSGSGGEDFATTATSTSVGEGGDTKENEATRRIRELEEEVEAFRFAALQGGDAMAALAATPSKSSNSSSSPGSPPLSPVRASGRPSHHHHHHHSSNHSGSMSSSKLSLKKAGSLRSLTAANQAAHAMIELPALKLQLAHLQEENQIIPELQLEIEILREEMEELQVDATSSRQAASQLSRILDQLREYKDSEVEKKKLEYDHLKIEEAWVNFVCQMMESNREQIQKLRDDFYLVVRVVEQQQQLEDQLRELKEVGGGSGSGGASRKKKTVTSKETAAAKTAVNKLAISQAQKLASQASQNIGRWWKNRRGTTEEEEHQQQQQRARQVSQALTNPAGRGGPVVKDVNSAWGAGTGGERPSIGTVDTSTSGSETVQVALDAAMDDADKDNITNENDDDEEEDDDDDDDSVNPARKLQQEILEQHIQFFDDKMEEMEQDMTAESETLESMRESLRQQREGLEEEIGVDELQRDSLDHVVEMQRDNELLEQLTALLIGGGGSGGAAAAFAKKMAEKLQEPPLAPMINDDATEKLDEAVVDDGLLPIVEDEEDVVAGGGRVDEREEKEPQEGVENDNKGLGDDTKS
jgi:hypothetical protein